MGNVIKFERSKKKEMLHNPNIDLNQQEREALDNFNTLLNILKTNMEILESCDADQAWFILCNSGIDFGNKPEVVKYVCDFYRAWLMRLYEDLDNPISRDSYLSSYLVADLNTAMSMMEADHTTRITFWAGTDVISIILARTWEIWGMTNMFVNGQSIHDACFQSMIEDGFTTEYLLNWKEADESTDGDE